MEEIMYLAIIVGLMPLSFVGIYKVVGFITEKIKTGLGYIKIHTITKNFRLKKRFSKPKGDKIEIKKGVSVPFTNKPPYLSFEGTTPVTIYTDKGEQMNLSNPKEKGTIDPDYFSNLVTEAYNLGILSAIKQSNVMKIIMLGAIIASLAAAAFGFLNWQTLSQMPVSG